MSVSHFSLAEQRALDSYTIPPMREGFARRVVERAMAEQSNGIAALPPLRPSQKRNPWSRTGRRIGAFVTLTILSGAAAAMGLFGNPERIPIVGEVLAQVFNEGPPERITKPAEPALASAPVERASSPVRQEPLPVAVAERHMVAPVQPNRLRIEGPQGMTAPAPSDSQRPVPSRMADIRWKRPEIPSPRLSAAAPDAQKVRERLSDAGIRETVIAREKLSDRIEQRIDLMAETPDANPKAELAAAAEIVQQKLATLPEADRAQLRAQAAERAPIQAREQRRQQIRERLQARPTKARPPRAKPRDIPRQRRELRKRRR